MSIKFPKPKFSIHGDPDMVAVREEYSGFAGGEPNDSFRGFGSTEHYYRVHTLAGSVIFYGDNGTAPTAIGPDGVKYDSEGVRTGLTKSATASWRNIELVCEILLENGLFKNTTWQDDAMFYDCPLEFRPIPATGDELYISNRYGAVKTKKHGGWKQDGIEVVYQTAWDFVEQYHIHIEMLDGDSNDPDFLVVKTRMRLTDNLRRKSASVVDLGLIGWPSMRAEVVHGVSRLIHFLKTN